MQHVVKLGLSAVALTATVTCAVWAQPAPGKENAPKKPEKTTEAKPKGVAHLRVLHAIAEAPAADLYLDGKKSAENVAFKALGEYLQVDSGKTAIKLTAAGKTDVLFESSTTLTRDAYVTAVAYGSKTEPKLLVQNDNSGKMDEKKARIRVFNVANGAPVVDLTTPSTRAKDGAADLIKALAFGKDATKLMEPGKIKLQFRADGKILKEVPDVTLEAGKKYAIFAVGKAGGEGEQAFDVLIKPMGN